jgi:hypothetical protein
MREKDRGYEARAAWRAEAYWNSTVTTASKRNEVRGGDSHPDSRPE